MFHDINSRDSLVVGVRFHLVPLVWLGWEVTIPLPSGSEPDALPIELHPNICKLRAITLQYGQGGRI